MLGLANHLSVFINHNTIDPETQRISSQTNTSLAELPMHLLQPMKKFYPALADEYPRLSYRRSSYRCNFQRGQVPEEVSSILQNS